VRIVLVNGRFASSGSCDGLTVEPLLMEGTERGAVGSIVADSADPLALLNTSLFDGGAFVAVAAGARLARPIEIVHRVGGAEPVTVMPRLVVEIGEGASATVIERFAGGPDGAVTNALNEVTIGAGAEVTWVKLQDGGPGETHFGTTFVAPADDAGLSHFMASTGDGYSRSQVFCRVGGTGAKAHFAAAAIAVGGRHVDHTVVVEHEALGSESREFFRSVAGSRGEAIVQGRIFIAPGAQKTDAQMMSNGLFLDDDGEIVNKPELEIYADDVQGAHGATAGGLDQAMLFYLRSRGVPKAEAERLLVEAFLLETAAGLADERLRAAVEGILVAALETAHGGARR
jgi:Fe-S cluster assembly protein SufD